MRYRGIIGTEYAGMMIDEADAFEFASRRGESGTDQERGEYQLYFMDACEYPDKTEAEKRIFEAEVIDWFFSGNWIKED